MLDTAEKQTTSNKKDSPKIQSEILSVNSTLKFLNNNVELIGESSRKEVKHICGNFYRINFFKSNKPKGSIMDHYTLQESRFYEVINTQSGLKTMWISDKEANKRWKI